MWCPAAAAGSVWKHRRECDSLVAAGFSATTKKPNCRPYRSSPAQLMSVANARRYPARWWLSMQQPRRECAPLGVGNRSKVVSVIPLPRPWLLAGAMLIGSAIGLLAGVACTVVVHTRIRPDIAIALVGWGPRVVGLLTILFSGGRWGPT